MGPTALVPVREPDAFLRTAAGEAGRRACERRCAAPWRIPGAIPRLRSGGNSPGEDGPLAIPVMAEEVALDGSEGDYELTAYIEKGAAATEASWQFHLTDPS